MNYCRIDVFMLAENIKNKTQSQRQLRLCFGLSEKICKERNAHCVYTPLFFDLTDISVKAFRDGMPAKNKTNLAKTPLFSRSLSNSRLKYV